MNQRYPVKREYMKNTANNEKSIMAYHEQLYPCNSISRDVIVFMEAKKPILCNNQKKVWTLQGNLHHDTSIFKGRTWVQIPHGQPWESCKLADPTSMQMLVCCRDGKMIEQYDTIRQHVFTWHDSGVFTPCNQCDRLFQNTKSFFAHSCVRNTLNKNRAFLKISNSMNQRANLENRKDASRGKRKRKKDEDDYFRSDLDENITETDRKKNLAIHALQTMLESSPGVANLFFMLNSLSMEEKEDVFAMVSARMQHFSGKI